MYQLNKRRKQEHLNKPKEFEPNGMHLFFLFFFGGHLNHNLAHTIRKIVDMYKVFSCNYIHLYNEQKFQ